MSTSARIARLNVTAANIEYFNNTLGHYLVTYDGEEARIIDAGGAGPGWTRTGKNGFKSGGATPVCRFYGTPGIGSNSHFFTISAQECALVKQDPGWTFEGYGFYATPAVNGQCEAPLVPVHRLYNNQAAQRNSNHRHVTDLSLVPAMTAQGWSLEGVAFCARP
jgi:serine protease